MRHSPGKEGPALIGKGGADRRGKVGTAIVIKVNGGAYQSVPLPGW
jgi:hypothetical protein